MSLRSSLGYRIGSTSKCQIKPSHPGKRRVLLATGGARHSHTDTHKPPSSALQFEGRQEQGLRMLLFGKPGSGKGTLSARLVKQYDIAFVSTGDVLRKEIAAQSSVGRRAEEVVAKGGLVSDELMLDVVKSELDRLRGESWVVDGFPRTLHQGELLDSVLTKEGRPLNMIVHLNVPDAVILERISDTPARWVHLPSGRVYNTTYSAPKVPGRDDVTGEALVQRPDDTPETFTKRLQAYYQSTAPLLDYFGKSHPESLINISGSTSDEVHPSHSSSSFRIKSFSKGKMYRQHPSPPSSGADLQANQAIFDQLWPQLQALVDPFGLRTRPQHLEERDVESVRHDADDLADPQEVEKEGAERGQKEQSL